MLVPVWWVTWEPETLSRHYWDQAVLEGILSGCAWQVPDAFPFVHIDAPQGVTEVAPDLREGAVVVVPGRHNAKHIDKLNRMLCELPWVLLIITGDEEGIFRLSDVQHPNMVAWHMTGRPQIDEGARRKLGSGYPPGLPSFLDSDAQPARDLDWFFAGQVTHQRRHDLIDALDRMYGGQYHTSEGFTEGLPQVDYWSRLRRAKVAPCPSGPASPDSFRLYEALECGCLPVADGQTPNHDADGYWNAIFPAGVPFPIVDDWSELPARMEGWLAEWPANANKVSAWWADYKRELAWSLMTTIDMLSGEQREAPTTLDDLVTVVVTTSPASVHPDTSALDETLASIRWHLPTAEIVLACDGVRPEQEELRPRYEAYLRAVLDRRYPNVLPLISELWRHQANLTEWALSRVRTPFVLFSEHDTPLVTDLEIDWDGLVRVLRSGEAELIRFHHESHVLPDHEHLMLDVSPRKVQGVPLRRTVQWSQRPHLATTVLYRRILGEHFSPDSRTMIEDTMHGRLHNAWREYGYAGWDRYRTWLYCPEGDTILRSYHLDTRGTDEKFEMVP